MIELPEAVTIAKQITSDLKGKRISAAMRGNAPHKFAFYSRSPEEYATILRGKTIGKARDHGSAIMVEVKPDHVLVLGIGGERILLHQDEGTLPKKHQLMLGFSDGTFLTVTVHGWGAALLLHESEVAGHPFVGKKKVSPISAAFTFDHFKRLFDEFEEGDARAIKFFMISKPGVWGVGNGYLQDILFRTRLHPRKRAVELDNAQKRALHKAIRDVLTRAVGLGGRDTEYDLHGNPGRYVPILDKRANGKPCPECGTRVEKISFLGGSSYFCPKCQAL